MKQRVENALDLEHQLRILRDRQRARYVGLTLGSNNPRKSVLRERHRSGIPAPSSGIYPYGYTYGLAWGRPEQNLSRYTGMGPPPRTAVSWLTVTVHVNDIP